MQTLAETHEANVAAARAIFAADGLDVGEIDTVVQPDEEGALASYLKGEEPPVPSVFRTDAAGRPQTPVLKPVAPIFEADVPKLKKADEAPQTVDGMAAKLGLREAEDLDDRADDSYTGWLPYKDAPLFYFDLSDEMKAEHASKVLELEKAKNQFSREPDSKKPPTLKQIDAMLEAKSAEAEAIGAMEVGIYDWVLDQAYRGCSKVRDWRRLPVVKRKAIADAIALSSNVGQKDLSLLMLR